MAQRKISKNPIFFFPISTTTIFIKSADHGRIDQAPGLLLQTRQGSTISHCDVDRPIFITVCHTNHSEHCKKNKHGFHNVFLLEGLIPVREYWSIKLVSWSSYQEINYHVFLSHVGENTTMEKYIHFNKNVSNLIDTQFNSVTQCLNVPDM